MEQNHVINLIVCRLVKIAQTFFQVFLNAKMNRFGMNLSSPQIHLLSTPRIHSDVEGFPSRTSDEQVIIEVAQFLGNNNKIIFGASHILSVLSKLRSKF